MIPVYIRYCVQAAQKRDFFAISDNNQKCATWENVIQHTYSVTKQALEIAMQVVAEVLIFTSFD